MAKNNLIDKLRPDVVKVHGPYIRKEDGRKHVVLYYGNDKPRITVSYPKWLMEQHLGRFLTEDETVDHKDRDFTNDDLDNLQILTRAEHSRIDAVRVELVEITCVWCKKQAFKRPRELNHAARQKKAGPFCSKRCSGKYGAEIGYKRTNKLPSQPIIPKDQRKYYKLEKE